MPRPSTVLRSAVDFSPLAQTMMESRSLRVIGRVHGVGFRWFVYHAAKREGITGFARNEPDGSVEIVAEGDQEALSRFEAAVRGGPARARVDAVDCEIGPASGAYADFSIRG